MSPRLAELEQAVAETPVSQIPALIGVLAELQAKAHLKMLSEQTVLKNREDGLLTMRQVAARLNVPASRAYELARQGKLPAVRIGKYVRVSEKSLLDYQASCQKLNEKGRYGHDLETQGSGCWAVDYRDATGKRIRLTASTRQEAETLLAEKIKETKEEHPTALALQDMTLKEYAERWSERVRGEIEEKTWRSYQQNLTKHVVPALGHIKVREITVSHVARFLAEKRKARYGTGEGKPYSRTAIRLMKAALSSVLTDAVELDGLLKSNPALTITSRKKRN